MNREGERFAIGGPDAGSDVGPDGAVVQPAWAAWTRSDRTIFRQVIIL